MIIMFRPQVVLMLTLVSCFSVNAYGQILICTGKETFTVEFPDGATDKTTSQQSKTIDLGALKSNKECDFRDGTIRCHFKVSTENELSDSIYNLDRLSGQIRISSVGMRASPIRIASTREFNGICRVGDSKKKF
jgi:hypothetical protein